LYPWLSRADRSSGIAVAVELLIRAWGGVEPGATSGAWGALQAARNAAATHRPSARLKFELFICLAT
jgi:hypothetical protein